MEHNHVSSYHILQLLHLSNSPHILLFNFTQTRLCSCTVLAKMFLFDSEKHWLIIKS